MAKLYYDRSVPFGFVSEQAFFAEAVEVEDADKVLKIAIALRELVESSNFIQDVGQGPKEQASEMATLILDIYKGVELNGHK